MHNTKKTGPRTELCGIPERTSIHEDLAPLSAC